MDRVRNNIPVSLLSGISAANDATYPGSTPDPAHDLAIRSPSSLDTPTASTITLPMNIPPLLSCMMASSDTHVKRRRKRGEGVTTDEQEAGPVGEYIVELFGLIHGTARLRGEFTG